MSLVTIITPCLPLLVGSMEPAAHCSCRPAWADTCARKAQQTQFSPPFRSLWTLWFDPSSTSFSAVSFLWAPFFCCRRYFVWGRCQGCAFLHPSVVIIAQDRQQQGTLPLYELAFQHRAPAIRLGRMHRQVQKLFRRCTRAFRTRKFRYQDTLLFLLRKSSPARLSAMLYSFLSCVTFFFNPSLLP